MVSMKYEPYFYQQYAENFILEHPSAGLFLDMGMGKTVITLTAAEKLMNDYFAVGKILIIAPLAPAKNTWPEEIRKWDHLQHLRAVSVLGSVETRISALNSEADIYIINRENVVWLVNYYKNKWPFDMVIIDELSSFKSSKSQRFRALRKVRKYIKRIVGLTGTPTPNGLMDLWPQVYLLDEGEALGRTLTAYRNRWFVPDKRNGMIVYSWRPITGAEKDIYARLDSLCVSMKTGDYLQLPDRLDIRHELDMPKKALSMYKQLEKDMLLPFEDGDIDAPTAAILTNKLMQAAGGAAYDENGGVKVFHSVKLDYLDRLIEEANGQPVLIFYTYKHERDRIVERHPEAVDVKTDNAVENWNNGEIPIILAHPASAGHGLNLQFGGHIIIWYSLPCSLELYQQANKRLHRMGQKETVLIHHLLMNDTIDTRVLDGILTPKEARQNALIEALKARIEEVKS